MMSNYKLPNPRTMTGQPFLVTPDDDNDQPHVIRAIAIGTVGDLAVKTLDGNTVVIPAAVLEAKVLYPVHCVRVLETDTTAEDIVAWY